MSSDNNTSPTHWQGIALEAMAFVAPVEAWGIAAYDSISLPETLTAAGWEVWRHNGVERMQVSASNHVGSLDLRCDVISGDIAHAARRLIAATAAWEGGGMSGADGLDLERIKRLHAQFVARPRMDGLDQAHLLDTVEPLIAEVERLRALEVTQ